MLNLGLLRNQVESTIMIPILRFYQLISVCYDHKTIINELILNIMQWSQKGQISWESCDKNDSMKKLHLVKNRSVMSK